MSDLPDESREPREIAELAELVRRETGSDLPAGRLGVLRDTAERRRRALGLADLDAYVAALAAGSLPGEWQRLATRLTIKESSFFRVPQQWERIRTKVLPELLHARAANRRLRCWSAACAAGEEPGTLALLLADAPALAGWDWSILATDLDVEALAEAGRGLYGERAIAGVPPPLRETWFRRRGSLWELDPRLRAKIAYRPLNLARPPWLLPEEAFDLVLLRNVLIYFRPELQRLVVERVADRLAPEGWLFLGGSETLWRVQERLVAVDLGDCFAYRHEGAAPAAPRARGPARTARAANTAKARPADGPDRRPAAAPSPAPAALPVPGPHPPASAREQLAAAVRHLEADRLREAERETEAALALDPADPEAHVLAGLLCDLGGRADGAVAALRAALYLEPGLAQARLFLAGCLRRLGETAHAERQFREVVATLERSGGRRLPLLDGRLLPDLGETLRRARAALQSP